MRHRGQKTNKYGSRSKRAGLNFPVGRMHRHLRDGRYTTRIGARTPVYLAAVLEYIMAEVLELSTISASSTKKKRITPRHIQLAIQDDEELSRLFGGVTIPAGGGEAHVHAVVCQPIET